MPVVVRGRLGLRRLILVGVVSVTSLAFPLAAGAAQPTGPTLTVGPARQVLTDQGTVNVQVSNGGDKALRVRFAGFYSGDSPTTLVPDSTIKLAASPQEFTLKPHEQITVQIRKTGVITQTFAGVAFAINAPSPNSKVAAVGEVIAQLTLHPDRLAPVATAPKEPSQPFPLYFPGAGLLVATGLGAAVWLNNRKPTGSRSRRAKRSRSRATGFA